MVKMCRNMVLDHVGWGGLEDEFVFIFVHAWVDEVHFGEGFRELWRLCDEWFPPGLARVGVFCSDVFCQYVVASVGSFGLPWGHVYEFVGVSDREGCGVLHVDVSRAYCQLRAECAGVVAVYRRFGRVACRVLQGRYYGLRRHVRALGLFV